MYSYILLDDDQDEVAMYLPSANKLVSTNQRVNENYSRSSFTRFIKGESRCNEQKKTSRSNAVVFFRETTRKNKSNLPHHLVDGLCYIMG